MCRRVVFRPGLRPLRPRVVFDNTITELAPFCLISIPDINPDVLKLATVSQIRLVTDSVPACPLRPRVIFDNTIRELPPFSLIRIPQINSDVFKLATVSQMLFVTDFVPAFVLFVLVSFLTTLSENWLLFA